MRLEVLENEMDVVSALRQGLASRIGGDRFQLWFGSQVQWESAGDVVILFVPDQFTLERVRRQFVREIQKTLATVTTQPMRLEIQIRAPRPVAERTDAAVENRTVENRTESRGARTDACSASASGLRVIPNPRSESTMPASERPLRREYGRFESFVTGSSNKVAVTAAEAVAQRLGAISPLLVYGPTGSGKTHLLEAVWSKSRMGQRVTRTLLLSAEQFTTFFLEALQGAGLPSFRRKVRDVDVLLLDDIQFFSGKRATLVEFQHTLDAITRQGRQLVVSSDRAPGELSGLGPELVARLTGGLVCGLDLADYETRRGITRQWIAREQIALPEAVADMIAAETNGDARQIRGALNRLRATSLALQQPITVDLARSALSDIFASAKRFVRLPDIERAVCEAFALEPKTLREPGKSRAVNQPRMLAMWLARKYTRMAFSEISEYFGRRSHTTVITAEQKVNRWVSEGTRLQLGGTTWTVEEALRRLETKIRTGS